MQAPGFLGAVTSSLAALVVLAAAPSTLAQASGQAAAVTFPQYPTLSPDGNTLVFCWGGDLWISPIWGGPASRLTVHPADERRAVFSPDGGQLAFESDRDGARNIYVMSVTRMPAVGLASASGEVRRLTASDRAQNLTGFTPDGASVVFGSYEPSIFRFGKMYTVPMPKDGVAPSASSLIGGVVGGPVAKLTEAYGSLPRISPDGSFMTFQRGSAPVDREQYRGSGIWRLWKMSTRDGSFTQLTDGPANDYDAWPLPDGSIVFVSARDGQNNLFRLAPGADKAAQPTQLTSFKPGAGELTIGHGVRDLSVTADGKTAVFCVWNTIYRLDLMNPVAKPEAISVYAVGDQPTGELQRLSVDKEISETVLSPDGKTIAMVARGDVFVRPITEGYPTRRVTASPGRERDLAWSPDGRVLYFSSDDPGQVATVEAAGDGSSPQTPAIGAGPNAMGKYSIYAASVSLAREDLAAVPPRRPTRDDAAKAEDKPAADPADPTTEPKPAVKPDPKSDPKSDPKPEPKAESDDEPTTKPAEPAKPADASTPAASGKPAAKKIDFGKRWQEALSFTIEPFVSHADLDVRHPVPSPDGRLMMYVRGLGDLMLLDLKDRAEKVLVTGWDDPDAIFAPDSRHIVYAVGDLDFNMDIWLLDSLGVGAFAADAKPPAPVNITRHPDNDRSPSLSADGKVLTFLSERATSEDTYDVHQVYLDKDLEGMSGYERDDYFKKAAEAAGKRKPIDTPDWVLSRIKLPASAKKDDKPEATEKPADDKADAAKPEAPKPAPARVRKLEAMRFDAEDAYTRIRRITSSAGGKSQLAVTPGADRIIFVGAVDGEAQLQSVDFKGADRKTIQLGGASGVTMSLTGDKVAYIRSGQAFTAPKLGGKADAWPIDAAIIVNYPQQQTQKFLEAARTVGDRFYHPTIKGLDWPGLTKRYLELVKGVRTSDEFNRLTMMLFSELNASHTGSSGGPGFSAPASAFGYLGVTTKPAAGGYEVVRSVADSPATFKGSKLNPGDVIVSIDGVELSPDRSAMPTIDFDAALLGKAGRETLLGVRRAKPAGDDAQAESADAPAFVVITPVSAGAWTSLKYQDDIRQRRELVDKLSGGKVGYLHIKAMGDAEVRDFERDLYAAAHGKQALIIDVRDNGGGSTADILLSSLTAPRHAWTAPRGAELKDVPRDAYPRDRRLIYGYTRPIGVLINQNAFSNAEIFAHAIKTTKRGTLIGEPTFGGVISTGEFSLIDGTRIRLPFRGWYLPNGDDMENNGATPDVLVAHTPMDDVAGRDPQLEAAVREMLK